MKGFFSVRSRGGGGLVLAALLVAAGLPLPALGADRIVLSEEFTSVS
ncbi:MAG: hypothetical protein JXQ75_10365 [Phycisphaerae bacterium]|nr:hypothetical protein [Phycisphaerae bacterium]